MRQKFEPLLCYSAEGKIRIVLDDLHSEDSIAELYCREGIATRKIDQTVRVLDHRPRLSRLP